MVDLELLRNASVEPCVDANISGLDDVKSANLRTALHATIVDPMAAGTFAMIDMTGFKFNIMKIVASKLERKAMKR